MPTWLNELMPNKAPTRVLARIRSRIRLVVENLSRSSRMKDPLEGKVDGGSPAHLKRLEQGIVDLGEHYVSLNEVRVRTNLDPDNAVTIRGMKRTLFAWWYWSKYVAPLLLELYGDALSRYRSQQQQLQRAKSTDKDNDQELIPHFNELEYQRKFETIQAIVEEVDDALSRANSTIQVDITDPEFKEGSGSAT